VHFIENSLRIVNVFLYLTYTHYYNTTIMKNLSPKAEQMMKRIGLNIAAVTYIVSNLQTIIKL
jgi:hypothetical protein